MLLFQLFEVSLQKYLPSLFHSLTHLEIFFRSADTNYIFRGFNFVSRSVLIPYVIWMYYLNVVSSFEWPNLFFVTIAGTLCSANQLAWVCLKLWYLKLIGNSCLLILIRPTLLLLKLIWHQNNYIMFWLMKWHTLKEMTFYINGL